ncbi:MAG: hypothetical protein IIZ73_10120 [Ruminococcus sp.]|nr:hypothetical protein [Ruminococcus sp.]
MDEQTAVKRVLAEYEKLVQSSPRIQALEKKLAEGTITMKEGAELNDLRARAFGKALSGSVTGIERGSREGACVSLLKDRCADVDELALAAQKTALTRQGLNLTPPTAPFEEERARKIGHSLEDDTVPDETIQRRARSATETMLRSQYDRDMKQGAKTCSDAGLRTYIVRDADPGCCAWCSAAAGRYTYGEEPKDVYRRHDNCSCTVVYESSRGKQNVWSKQTWSKEQEQEYLRLRDEMAPKRLNARQAAELREKARADFEDTADIKRALNVLTGKGYLNTIKDFEEQLQNVQNEMVRSILESTAKKVRFEKSKDSRNRIINDTIYLANSAIPSTIAHELFHKVDTDNKISSSGVLDKCVKSDYDSLIKQAQDAGQTIEDMLYLKYPNAFERKGLLKSEYRGVSDIINGMTGGQVNLGYRHSNSYWAKPQKLQRETFAQYGRMLFEENEDTWAMVRDIFPGTTKQIDSIIPAVAQFGR